MELWLLRHAKAAPNSPTGRDRDRPLSEKGLAQCDRLHDWLTHHMANHAVPSKVRFSPATRTRQTTEAMIQDLPVTTPQPMDALIGASTVDLVDIIKAELSSHEGLWLIGHNPGLEEVVAWLSRPLGWPGLTPGTLLRFQIEGSIHAGCADVLEIVQPKE